MSEIVREIGSTLAKLRALLQETKKDLPKLRTLLQSLEIILADLWQSDEILHVIASPQLWKELLSLVASGKVLSTAAQAGDELKKSVKIEEQSWIVNGQKYATWLALGTVALVRREVSEEGRIFMSAAELYRRSFTIGYTDKIVETVIESLLSKNLDINIFQSLISSLPRHDQRHLLLSTLTYISGGHLPKSIANTNTDVQQRSLDKRVASCAALIELVASSPRGSYREHLLEWLKKSASGGIALLRACLAVLSQEQIGELAEYKWQQFSDNTNIRHCPIFQQEATTQILLICAGYIHRSSPTQLFMLARSSLHTSGTSERLSSSSQRARFLGMVVGVVTSLLVDKPESQLRFKFSESEEQELHWYKSLVKIDDKVGSLYEMALPEKQNNGRQLDLVKAKRPTSMPMPRQSKSEKPKITIVEDSEEEDDDNDLVPYAKPDSDAEDSDEDASVARRDKPKAPVYIRDLLSQLESADSPTAHQLAICTAAPLITRKAHFGAELKDLSPALAYALLSLQDHFATPEFYERRQDAMVALIAALPEAMGPWFANAFFSGDYSIGQRVGMLGALGMAGRKLAGLDSDVAEDPKGEPGFPTKKLPRRLHDLFSNGEQGREGREFQALVWKMEDSMLSPSSTRLTPQRPRKKVARNDLSKVLAQSFFFPLTGQWQVLAQSKSNVYLTPQLLPHYIHTLSLLVSAAGPGTPQLVQLTSEFWDLLLSLRSRASAANDTATMEALLFGFLTLLQVNRNGKKRLATDFGREVVETGEWAGLVFEKLDQAASGGIGAGGRDGVGDGGILGEVGGSGRSVREMVRDDETERCRGLAAGVLVACKEVGEEWRGLMLGH